MHRHGKMLVYTGTATSAGAILPASHGAAMAGGDAAKIKTIGAPLTISFREGKDPIVLTVADGWQDFYGHFPSVFVQDSTGTAQYTVIITTVG